MIRHQSQVVVIAKVYKCDYEMGTQRSVTLIKNKC